MQQEEQQFQHTQSQVNQILACASMTTGAGRKQTNSCLLQMHVKGEATNTEIGHDSRNLPKPL